MNRRALLTAGAASWAAWVTDAFAMGPSPRQIELWATWRHAQSQGLPLLVIVIPTDDLGDRGSIVGAALGEANGGLLAKLAAYAPVCATRADLHLLGVVVPEDAWFAVVDTGGVPASSRSIAGPTGAADPINAVKELLHAALDARPGDADAGRERWVAGHLPGSRWASSWGCGITFEPLPDDPDEGENGGAVACGLGSVPARTQRFLWFHDQTYPW